MNKKISGAMLALAFALAGCAGSPYDIARKHEALRNYEGADAGVVIASAGASNGSRLTSSSVTFHRRNTEDLVSIHFTPTQKPDWETSINKGVVFVKRLPPGEYELRNADGSKLHSGTGYTCTRPLPAVVTFTVHPGDIIYLGRYVTTSSPKDCITVYISNEQQSDVAQARARSPIPAEEVRSYAPATEQRL